MNQAPNPLRDHFSNSHRNIYGDKSLPQGGRESSDLTPIDRSSSHAQMEPGGSKHFRSSEASSRGYKAL